MTVLATRRLATAQFQDTATALKAEYPGLVLTLHRRGPREVLLELMSVPVADRRRRIGTAVMAALCDEADRLRVAITLHVSDGFGTPRAALVDFYQAHGFVRVRPKSAAMRRDPHPT